MDWEEIIYSAAEYIPGYGTLYSFNRMRHADIHGDPRKKWISGVNFIQGLARDLVLVFGATEAVPVVVVHAAVEGLTDKITDLLTAHNSPKSGLQADIDDEPRRDIEHKLSNPGAFKNNHVNVLVAGNVTDQHAGLKHLNDMTKHDFRGIMAFYGAVYVGKLTYLNGSKVYALNENIVVSFPTGMHENGKCLVSSTWTTPENGSAKDPFMLINAPIQLDRSQGKFQIGPVAEGYYWIVGFIRDGGSILFMQLWSSQGECTEFSVYSQFR